MEITFLGGADEVGASCILIETAGRRILVDAGIRPTPKASWGLEGDQLPDLSVISGRPLDCILVTHAHTDHTGALELVIAQFRGVPVYATPVTIELTRVLHQDARRIMQARLDEEGELPLYDDVATAHLMSAFRPVAWRQPLPVAPGIMATFFPAGHIAGAAMIGLDTPEGRLLISGDISISPQRTVDGARPPAFTPDVLILESTYGNRLHANRRVEEQRLVESVAAVTAAGGKVLIPAFALGRAQEILLTLGEFQRRGALPPIPVWADGMVRAVCQAYANFPDALPLALQEQGAQFFTDTIHPVTSAEQRNQLIWDPAPAVIVASSGMLAGGPSLAYARALVGGPQHAILLTGYQDEEAPGRRLQEMATHGRGVLRIGRDKFDVQCQIGTYSLSAHADSGQLVSFVETLDPATVLLVHGDTDARQSLAAALRARARNVRLPRSGQSFGFSYAPRVRTQVSGGVGRGQPPDPRRLWELLISEQRPGFPVSGGDAEPDEAGEVVTREVLAELWWGPEPAPSAAQLEQIAQALTAMPIYFALDPARPDTYRMHSRNQVALAHARQAKLAAHGDLQDRWLLARDLEGAVRPVRVVAVATDHILVQAINSPDFKGADGEGVAPGCEVVWPEDILSIVDSADEAASALERLANVLQPDSAPAAMEPNRALALAARLFPSPARLRKSGYRLADHVLTLTFDFPDVVAREYAAELEALAQQSGWQVEVVPEANQGALNALVMELLGAGWQIQKGPSIHRLDHRVTTMATPPEHFSTADIVAAQERYRTISGYTLEVTIAVKRDQPALQPAVPGAQVEINAAYAAIREGLAGSTLYRTSLKDGAIVLSFISPQVGARHMAAIEQLAQQTGWPLRINPQPNQGAIVDLARLLLAERDWTAIKGPSFFGDRNQVSVTLAEPPEEEALIDIQEQFATATGFDLVLQSKGQTAPARNGQTADLATAAGKRIELTVAQVRVPRSAESMPLNSEKLESAIQRARRDGQITPPIVVRRLRDNYLLMDGLYRLRAAQALGLPRIAAIVEA